MFGRYSNSLILLFWLLSMTWLVAEKIIPPLRGGDPPDYQSGLTVTEAEQQARPPDAWRLKWRERSIGFAASELQRHPDGSVNSLSFVEFENLPLESLLTEVLGPMAAVVKPFMGGGGRQVEIHLLVASRTKFDAQQRLVGFDTTVDVNELQEFMKLHGTVTLEGKLLIVAHLANGTGGMTQVLKQTIDLPPEALVEGSLAPRSELRDLYVGQTWTIPIYRAFPPNSPVEIVQAEVEKYTDVKIWGNDEVETLVVVYRADAGSSLSAGHKPLSREWVRRSDGVVLWREINFSDMTILFERQTESGAIERQQRLDELHARLWAD